jgi:uncharacterized protein YfaS (alpha-2-macroglobulin family)
MSTATLTASAPAGRWRFWLTVLCFFIANCAAWVVYDHIYAIRHRGTLRVVAFEPGDNAVVDPHAEIRWHFSDDVIPTTAYGKDPGKVTPTVPGRWAWQDPRTLVFTPATGLPRATPVTFALATDLLRTGSGAALKDPYVTSVHCTPLAIDSITQAASIENNQFVLEFKFTDRVSPGDVLSHVQATLPDGHPIGLRIYGQATGETIRLATDTVPIADEDDTRLTVKLVPGLTGLSGPLGLADSYQTSVLVNRRLMVTSLKASASSREQPQLQLRFNNLTDTEALKKVLSVEPVVPFVIETDGGENVILDGNFQPGTRYTVTIAALPAGASASARMKTPHAAVLSAFMPDKSSDVWFDNDQGYLSTAGNRTLMAHCVNVPAIKVSLTRMYDNNLVTWRNAVDGQSWSETDSYSKPIAMQIIPVSGAKNVQGNIPLSIDSLLPRNADPAGVWRVTIQRCQPGKSADDSDESERYDSRESAVVTLSDIGLTAKQTHGGLLAWATSLRGASPLVDVRIRAYSSKNQLLGQAVTDRDGLAHLTNIHPAKDETVSVLLAEFVQVPSTQPTDDANGMQVDKPQLTWLDLSHNHWELGDSDVSGQRYLREENAAYVYTDRGVYRPGETVHLRAIVRGAGNAAPKNTFPVKWQLRRPDLRDWKSETVMLDSDGAAAADIALPTDLPSGQWSASIALPGADEKKNESLGSVNFQIEDFIPNRLKVSLNLSTAQEKEPRRYTIGQTPLNVEVQGDYLFGRPASGLILDLSSHANAVAFNPTGWYQWVFGDNAGIANIPKSADAEHAPEKHHHRPRSAHTTGANVAGDEEPAGTDTLDTNGKYTSPLDVAGIVRFAGEDAKANEYRGPWLMTAQAGVREPGGRAVTISRQITIDALPAYIGIRRSDGRSNATPGVNNEFQIKLVKPDGAPAAETDADLSATLLHETWNTVMVRKEGRYQYESTRVLNPVSSATVHATEGVGSWSVLVPQSGEFVLKVVDPTTGAMTTMGFYATNGSGWNENVDRENPERLQVRLLSSGEDENSLSKTKTKQTWHVGDTARVLVAAPFAGRLLLSVETDDVISTQVIQMTSSHMVIPVPVTDACWPNAFISATVIRGIDPDAKWQTHRAFGITRLPIDSTSHQLQITLDAPQMLRPLQSLDVVAKVTDSEGNPVANAAINFAAVDEGICSLTDFKTPDPLKFFSSNRALGVDTSDLYGLLMPEVARTHAVGGDASKADMGRYRSPVGARRVKPVALAWVTGRSDADGIARGSFSLPQFQGKLRIIAVGYTPTLLGSADRAVTVRSPILAQSSWPRFAAPGDRFSVPIVLFNNTEMSGQAAVSVELMNDERTPAGLLGFGSGAVRQMDLPPVNITGGGQAQVNLDVLAGQAVGVGRVQISVAFGSEFYHEEVELPVRPASPMMQFGGIGAASTTQPSTIGSLTAMMPGTDSLHVNLTPWPTLNLPKGLEYLDEYPYGCCEQTTSVCFPLIALGDIGKTIDPVRFDPQRIHDKIDAGITRLIGMQTADGGLSMWQGQTDDWAWGSVYAAHFLTEARAAGYEVPIDYYDRLESYLRGLTDKGTEDVNQLEVQAYAAYVLTLAGKPDRATLDRLTELSQAGNRADDPVDGWYMRDDARLMLASAWLLAGRRDLAEGLMPDAIPVGRMQRQWNGNLGSPTRDRALLILTMEQVQPNRPELPGLIQQLADAGAKNQWASTQDVAFSVLAIGRYLRDAHEKMSYQSARLLAGDAVIGEAGAGGSIAWTADPSQLRSASPLRLELTGPARAVGYLSWLQTGVPMAPPADAEHGLEIHRRYLTLDGKQLNGTVQTGELVRVELTIEAPPGEGNLVIEDLLPAGLETENPRLETAAKDTAERDNSTFGNGCVDMRDDRVIIAGDMPNAWKAHCSYLARAVTPGTFTVPPVRCEAMYDANTNAVSGAGKLTVAPLSKVISASAD